MHRKSQVRKLDIRELLRSTKVSWWEARTMLSKGFVTLTFVVLIGVTLWTQQTIGTESVIAAEANVISRHFLSPPRGLFYDRNGVPLVENHASFSLAITKNHYLVKSEFLAFASLVGQVKPLDGEAMWQSIQTSEDTQVILVSGLTQTEKVQLQSVLKDNSYQFLADHSRYYPYALQYAHLLGYVGLANAEEVADGAVFGDTIGKYRLENNYNEALSGVKGQVLEQPGRQRVIPEVPGNNVVLTLDHRWQHSLYHIVASQAAATNALSGAAAIMDVGSGDILAYVSYPSFDPNSFVAGITESSYQELLTSDQKPLVDKVASSQVSPGSIFKIATAYGLLQNDVIDDTTRHFSTGCMQISAGFPFCEYGKYYLGNLDLPRALSRSSNIFFCQSIITLSNQLGYQQFADTIQQLGMGQKTGIELEGELAGVLASPSYKLQTYKQSWFLGDACNAVIGQGYTLVTPLQMLSAVATITNGGKYYKPNLVQEIRDQAGTAIESDFGEVVREIPLAANDQELILRGMYNAAHTPEGTAYRFLHSMPGNFRAKTGSAEALANIGGTQRAGVNGWIVGTFEHGGKEYAYVVHMQFGGGGWNASQVIQRFAHCLFSDFSPQCEG